MTKLFRIKQFSELTHVTVRTLHYYDKINLLKPTGKTEAGHRLYSENDLLRLQQILTLKFLGFSLTTIKNIVVNENFELRNSLKCQADMLRLEAKKMNKAAELIRYMEYLLETGKNIDWETLIKIIEVMQMSKAEQVKWQEKFLNQEELKDFNKLVESRPKEEWDEYHKMWLSMLNEIKQNIQHAPGSEVGQRLAKKWLDLVDDVYGDYPHLREKMWIALKSDSMPKDDFPYTSEVIAYIEKAVEILKKKK